MTTFLPPEPQTPQPEGFPADLPCPPPAEWMPLDEIAVAWGSLGATTLDARGWLATSNIFAALAMETEAYRHSTRLLRPVGPPTRALQAAASATLCALDEALSRWQMALRWLQDMQQSPLPADEDAAASIADGTLSARSRWHLLRVSRLQARLREQWIGQGLWPAAAEEEPEAEA